MNERVMEIVFYIVDAMQSNIPESIQHRFESLSQKLIEEGYTETEIDSAITWLVEKMPTKIEGESIIETAEEHQLDNFHIHISRRLALRPHYCKSYCWLS